jgi:hypothetical protein
MNNRHRSYYVWGVLAGGVMFISVLPSGSWLGQVTAPYCANPWVRFLAYAAVAAIPYAAWRMRWGILCSLLAAGFSVAYGLFHTIGGGPAGAMQNIPPDLFGVAAGVLLGLNLRFIRNSAEAAAGIATERRRPTVS